MVGKRVSGQTIAIIILAILLLLTIAFGGVFAYYSARSKKVTGTIVMANLNIDLISNNNGTAGSGKSEIVISNGTNVVPGQELKNSPLTVVNRSNAAIYLVVVYEVNANKLDEKGNKIEGGLVVDGMQQPVIDINAQYINMVDNITKEGTNAAWVDYLFSAQVGGETIKYRCLVSTQSYTRPNGDPQEIEVIGENKLKLHRLMNNEYQQTSISFAFQAYAIGATTFNFAEDIEEADRCNQIVGAIFESVEYKFLDATINN